MGGRGLPQRQKRASLDTKFSPTFLLSSLYHRLSMSFFSQLSLVSSLVIPVLVCGFSWIPRGTFATASWPINNTQKKNCCWKVICRSDPCRNFKKVAGYSPFSFFLFPCYRYANLTRKSTGSRERLLELNLYRDFEVMSLFEQITFRYIHYHRIFCFI